MNFKTIGNLKSSPVIKRFSGNPVLSSRDIPYKSDLVFNAGVVKYHGKYVMVFRNDYGWSGGGEFDGTNLGVAYSEDGISWTVSEEPCFVLKDDEIKRAYDPRLTVIDDRIYMCFAVDTWHGVRGGIAATDDFKHFEILDISTPDNRNMVLFPEKINGRYVRLERPFPVYSRGGIDRFDIWMSESYDLRHWGNARLVLAVESVPYANNKIGPAAPPVKTPFGWLTTFHAVDLDASRGKNGWEEKWQKRYTAGIMLLDLECPSKVIGMSKEPLIAPEAVYEHEGYRNDVIFPGGMILEDSGEVRIYYGGADTVECLATAYVDELIKLCSDKK